MTRDDQVTHEEVICVSFADDRVTDIMVIDDWVKYTWRTYNWVIDTWVIDAWVTNILMIDDKVTD